MSTLHIVFTCVGAAAELGGVALVILDVREARRAAVQAKMFHQTIRGGTAYEADAAGAASGHAETLPLETRVGQLEQAVAELATRTRRANRAVHQDDQEAVSSVYAYVNVQTRDTRAFISDQLRSGIGRSLTGAILITVGIALSAAANLV